MNLATAKHYGEKTINWIMPYAWPAHVAGSIRRQRPTCNDIDIVCIPKIDEQKDMLGAVISRKNLVADFITEYVKATPTAKILAGNQSAGKLMVVQLPKCQLDLWFADEKTLATRLLCRTGSMQHNIWLAGRAKRKGLKWNPYEGILSGGHWIGSGDSAEYIQNDIYTPLTVNQFASEEEIYAFLDLPFIEPKNREIEYLVKHFGQ